MRTDAERLDWISRQDDFYFGFGIVIDSTHDGEYYVSTETGLVYGKTFRDAIDAAMQRETA